MLSEAILALEAEVQRHPGHTDAWRLLGTAHAENEDDVQVPLFSFWFGQCRLQTVPNSIVVLRRRNWVALWTMA